MEKELKVGSTFKDGEDTIRVIGRYEDGSLLGTRMDAPRLAALKRAVSKAHVTLGNRNMVALAQALSSYSPLTMKVRDEVVSDLSPEDRSHMSIGLTNLAMHTLFPDEVPEGIFIGPQNMTEEGIQYRIKCPFSRISRNWLRVVRSTRNPQGNK